MLIDTLETYPPLLEISLTRSEKELLRHLRDRLPPLHQQPSTMLPYPYRLKPDPDTMALFEGTMAALQEKHVVHFVFPGTLDKFVAALAAWEGELILVYPVSLWLLKRGGHLD